MSHFTKEQVVMFSRYFKFKIKSATNEALLLDFFFNLNIVFPSQDLSFYQKV